MGTVIACGVREIACGAARQGWWARLLPRGGQREPAHETLKPKNTHSIKLEPRAVPAWSSGAVPLPA